MKKVFFKKDYHHAATEPVGTTFRAHYEGEVEDDIAEIAIVRGFAVYSDFAEDDLINRADIVARGDLIREEVQGILDAVLGDDGDE
ncbi:hypothetical protein [Novosphingobium sp.]|jgi:hypothetical protein|uniref:hypothetical protein n=1 Tax=Novosphingobium sp. TaxID=1874826 RepID=UPI002FE2660B